MLYFINQVAPNCYLLYEKMPQNTVSFEQIIGKEFKTKSFIIYFEKAFWF
jgi:hypothetical protein